MKLGVRRYENSNGNLTPAGKKRYAKEQYKQANKAYSKAWNRASNYSSRHPIGQFTNKKKKAESDKRWDEAMELAKKANEAKKAYKSEKKEYKKSLNKAYDDIRKSESLGSKMTYSDATYRKAAKNMVNKGMSQEKAVSKAKVEAWRNTGIAAAGMFMYANKDKIISGVSNIANQRAMQRANKSLAKIGTLTYEKVAGNVYKQVMK